MKNRKLRTYLWLTLCLSLLLFTACVNNDDTGSSSDNLHSSSQNQGNNNFSMAGESPIANDGDIVVFANFDNFKTTSTGNSNRTESYQQITGIYGIITEDMATNTLLAKDYFDSNSTNYENLTDEVIIKYSGDKVIPVTNKVTYIDYTIDDRYTPKQEWIDYFKGEISNDVGIFQSPIIIRDSWSTSYGDTEIEIVNCNNFIYDWVNVPAPQFASVENIPLENSVVYNKIAFFINGEVYKFPVAAIKVPNIPLDANTYVSFALPSYCDNLIGISSYSYQYNKNNNIIKSPIFAYNYAFKNIEILSGYLIFDVNKDDMPEIIKNRYSSSSLYNSTLVFSYNKYKQELKQIRD